MNFAESMAFGPTIHEPPRTLRNLRSSKAAHSLRSGENASSNERLILLSILRFLRLFDEDGDGAANCC